MDNIGGFIGDNAAMGQGLAFVLPQSKTEAYAMQLGQQHAAELRANALAQQKLKQQQEQEYQQSFGQQKLPEYWGKVGQQVNEKYNDWLNEASKYHGLTNKDPFKNPNFISKYNDILLMARQSKELEKSYTELTGKIAADHDNRFTEDSKHAALDWVQGVDQNPLAYLNQAAPQLSGTPSGIQDFYKTIKPVSLTTDNGTLSKTIPNTSAMMQQAYTNSQDPRWNNMLSTRYGVNTDIGDIGSVYNPQGKRVWYTNPTAVNHIADEILANPTVAHNADILARTGIKLDNPYAKESLANLITKQNAGYGKFITEAGQYGNSLVSPKENVTPDRFYEHYQYELAHPRPTKADGTKGQPAYYQDLFERIRTGDENARQELGKVFENNPAFLNGVHYDVSNPQAVKITIPAKYANDVSKISIGADGKPVPNSDRKIVQRAHTITLDSTNPVLFNAGLAQAFAGATGEKAALPSKILTPNAKGKVPGGQQVTTVNNKNQTVNYNGKSYGKDAVAKAAAASGMTVEQYLKAISK